MSPREAGFTLIEMLVALTIFGLAALALLRLEGATVSNAAALNNHTLGQIVAKNLAVEALTDQNPPTRGTTSGVIENAGMRWRWVRVVGAAAQPGLQQIDIAVQDQTGQPTGSLVVFRLGQ